MFFIVLMATAGILFGLILGELQVLVGGQGDGDIQQNRDSKVGRAGRQRYTHFAWRNVFQSWKALDEKIYPQLNSLLNVSLPTQ